MLKNSQYLILPFIQGVGGFILWFSQINLPETMPVYKAVMFLLFAVLVILIPRLIWILISSYIINLSKYIFYRLNGNRIISVCLYPFFVCESKKYLANIFWVYDDRTCFSMNKYLKNAQGYEKLRQHILNRNRILAFIYCVCSLLSVWLLYVNKHYVVAWIVLFGSVEHFLYQSEYKTIGSANAMAFAGLNKVDDRLMLHMFVNQSKIEKLYFGQEVIEILSEEMFKQDGDYFFKYLCLSGMFIEVCDGSENALSKYIDVVIKNIIECSPKQLKTIEHMKKDIKYKDMGNNVCIFYNSYREFLLYVLMYYRIKRNRNAYIELNNYIKYMLNKIEKDCVKDTVLSETVLAKKFREYKELYQQVLDFEFVPETSMFTGYDTLPVWKENREKFVNAYRDMNLKFKNDCNG